MNIIVFFILDEDKISSSFLFFLAQAVQKQKKIALKKPHASMRLVYYNRNRVVTCPNRLENVFIKAE